MRHFAFCSLLAILTACGQQSTDKQSSNAKPTNDQIEAAGLGIEKDQLFSQGSFAGTAGSSWQTEDDSEFAGLPVPSFQLAEPKGEDKVLIMQTNTVLKYSTAQSSSLRGSQQKCAADRGAVVAIDDVSQSLVNNHYRFTFRGSRAGCDFEVAYAYAPHVRVARLNEGTSLKLYIKEDAELLASLDGTSAQACRVNEGSFFGILGEPVDAGSYWQVDLQSERACGLRVVYANKAVSDIVDPKDLADSPQQPVRGQDRFPIGDRPIARYDDGSYRGFGTCRSNCTRWHAAVDLWTPVGKPVYASKAGVVIDYDYFYCGTYATVVQNDDGTVIRYGEVGSLSVPVNSRVRPGQKIGTIGKLTCFSQGMLHFELFSGAARGPLTNRNDPRGFQRRSDLLNPTKYMQQLEREAFP